MLFSPPFPTTLSAIVQLDDCDVARAAEMLRTVGPAPGFATLS
jgi:hypothetical protein